VFPIYADRVTPSGIAVLLSLAAAFILLYLLSYPLADLSRGTILSASLGNTVSFFYTVLGLVGIVLVARYRKNISTYEVVLGVMTATIVCFAIETTHWSKGGNLFHLTYELYVNGLLVFLVVLGALAMLKSEQVLHVRIAEEQYSKMMKSYAFGWVVGFPLALINVAFFTVVEKLPMSYRDILDGFVIAAGTSITEGVACRLLLMGIVIVLLRKHLPKKYTVAAALFAGAFFAPAIAAYGILPAAPVQALTMVAVSGLLFALPMALLAYYRDVESAIGVHWIVAFIQYILGY
jgi:hypothetical protein